MFLINTITFWRCPMAAKLRFDKITAAISSILVVFLLIILIWALVHLRAVIWWGLLLFLHFLVFDRFMSFWIEVSLLRWLWNNQELFDDVVDILLSLDCIHEEVLVIRVIFVWIQNVLLLVCIVISYNLHVSIIVIVIFNRLNNLLLILTFFFTLERGDLVWWCDLINVLTHHDLMNAAFSSIWVQFVAFGNVHHGAR